jgi:ribosome-binding protein aMBF1 (putative translation factor)
MRKCKLCGDLTDTVFNIDFKAVPVCEGCAASVFLQQANWYIKESISKIHKTVEKDNNNIFKHINE